MTGQVDRPSFYRHWSLRHATEIRDGLLEEIHVLVLPADVDLAVDSVDFRIETQQDSKCRREVVGQRRLADRRDAIDRTIDDELDRYVGLSTTMEFQFKISKNGKESRK